MNPRRSVAVGQLFDVQESPVVILELIIFHLFLGKCLNDLMS